MTQEDKQLIIKDLCARLPYRVKVKTPYDVAKVIGIVNRASSIKGIKYTDIVTDNGTYHVKYVKPYLRPMSSMTLEELEEYRHFGDHIRDAECKIHIANYKQIDWLNANHFDYRALIDRGLALEAPEGMYNVKINNYGNNY